MQHKLFFSDGTNDISDKDRELNDEEIERITLQPFFKSRQILYRAFTFTI